jgi:ATP-dependent DNA helicase DinG
MHRIKNGILLGTNAFWEGVDLPRDLLEILIISKLPFSVPTEPRVQAYSNMLQQQGRNSFMDFSVPEAVVRFRQGFGRLIRTIEDEGLFIVMDERIVEKRYGSIFSDTIPVQMEPFSIVEELIK